MSVSALGRLKNHDVPHLHVVHTSTCTRPICAQESIFGYLGPIFFLLLLLTFIHDTGLRSINDGN